MRFSLRQKLSRVHSTTHWYKQVTSGSRSWSMRWRRGAPHIAAISITGFINNYVGSAVTHHHVSVLDGWHLHDKIAFKLGWVKHDWVPQWRKVALPGWFARPDFFRCNVRVWRGKQQYVCARNTALDLTAFRSRCRCQSKKWACTTILLYECISAGQLGTRWISRHGLMALLACSKACSMFCRVLSWSWLQHTKTNISRSILCKSCNSRLVLPKQKGSAIRSTTRDAQAMVSRSGAPLRNLSATDLSV